MTRGVKLLGTVFAVCLFILGSASQAEADTVVTFDIGSTPGFIAGYTEQGFTFSGFLSVQANQLLVSDINISNPITVTFEGGAFDFVGLDYVFAGGFSNIIITASNGATFTPPFPGASYVLGPEFQNITSLTITHFRQPVEGPTFNLFDNFRFQPRATSAVPEPATILLLATGLAGAGAAARRRRKSD